jgi:hypothetical protein
MSIQVLLVLSLIILGTSAAYSRGGPPERFAAVLLAGLVLVDTVYHLLFGPSGFDRVDPWHVFLDVTMLGLLMWLALRANRIWPLFVAAAQLLSVTGHIAVLVQPDGMRRAYWAMTQIPQYIQLIALLAGAIAHARRERMIGPYRSWRVA